MDIPSIQSQPGMGNPPGHTVSARVAAMATERATLRLIIDAGSSSVSQRQRWIDLGLRLEPFIEAKRIKDRFDALQARAARNELSVPEFDTLQGLGRQLDRQYKGMF